MCDQQRVLGDGSTVSVLSLPGADSVSLPVCLYSLPNFSEVLWGQSLQLASRRGGGGGKSLLAGTKAGLKTPVGHRLTVPICINF